MIKSFKNKAAEVFYRNGKCPAKWRAIEKVAVRKLFQIDSAQNLNDLKAPPGNRLEALKGNRKGQFSIRINDRWRICFKWTGNAPEDVEIVDYH